MKPPVQEPQEGEVNLAHGCLPPHGFIGLLQHDSLLPGKAAAFAFTWVPHSASQGRDEIATNTERLLRKEVIKRKAQCVWKPKYLSFSNGCFQYSDLLSTAYCNMFKLLWYSFEMAQSEPCPLAVACQLQMRLGAKMGPLVLVTSFFRFKETVSLKQVGRICQHRRI